MLFCSLIITIDKFTTMKNLLLSTLFLLVVCVSANAQFHVELGLNFNSPQGDFADSYDLGVGVYIEPKYALNDNLDLGLLIGSNGFAGADFSAGGVATSVGATSVLAILPTGTYRFSDAPVTPYAGLGLGIYSFKGAEVTVAGVTVETESNSEFGFAPRAGVYLGRVNLGIAYNIVKDANFLQFNLGARIGSR